MWSCRSREYNIPDASFSLLGLYQLSRGGVFRSREIHVNVTCHFPCKLAVFFFVIIYLILGNCKLFYYLSSSITPRVHWQYTMMHLAVYTSLQCTNQLLYSIQRCDYQNTSTHPAYTNALSIHWHTQHTAYNQSGCQDTANGKLVVCFGSQHMGC